MEDVQTSQNQIQLLEHTAFQDHSQPWIDDGVKDALVSQEVLGSWDHILAAPEPRSEPVIPTEPVPEVAVPAEVSIEPEPEAPSSVEEAALEESVVVEIVPDAETLVEAVEKDPVAEFTVGVHARVPAIVEEWTAIPAEVAPQFAIPFDDIVVSEPGETSQIEEAAVPVMSDIPTEVTVLVAAPLDFAVTASAPTHESLESGDAATPVLNEYAAPGEDAVPTSGEVFLYYSVHSAFHNEINIWDIMV